MSKCKDVFNNKFRLLCSQESHEEIHWSSSESSEYENVTFCDKQNITHNQQKRKRKRKKQKVPKNISNLDITIIDVATEKDLPRIEKKEESSPILSSQYHASYKWNTEETSPILCPKTINSKRIREESSISPILVLKTASPTCNPKVKKKLFTNVENIGKISTKSKSVALNYESRPKYNDLNLIRSHSIHSDSHRNKFKDGKIKDQQLKNNNNFNHSDQLETWVDKKNKGAIKLDDSLESLKSTKDLNLVDKVKSYFDSHFSSESASQVTIQDSLTPKNSKNSSKTSDDIEIISTITQIHSNKNSTDSIKEELITNEIENKSKKIRYKKDGLAYRLNALLKKHYANVSLWQHERFLAANSNFIIPKGEYLVFIIRNVEIKYGCFLVQARNIENEGFLILINNDYVNNCNISKDVILKLYEPYMILKYNDDFKLIINVCKFECQKLNL